ncbi:MAG: nucleoid-associated protein, YbaB/EbfC family [Ignavibacteria bacterium]|nr:nucleoid-associated protein, YbaB/EbfC family [Ignavibacteria bacterium]
MSNILEQAQKVQSEMERIKNDLGNKTATGDAGGGMVTATVNGNNKLVSLKISKEIVNPEDIEMLEDLVVAAVNKAQSAAQEMSQMEMGRLSGMLPNIPGLNFNP